MFVVVLCASIILLLFVSIFQLYQDEGTKVESMAILMLGMKVMWLMELNHEDKEREKCSVED
jgi:hypothetical protein